jgi:hypothetical protein
MHTHPQAANNTTSGTTDTAEVVTAEVVAGEVIVPTTDIAPLVTYYILYRMVGYLLSLPHRTKPGMNHKSKRATNIL